MAAQASAALPAAARRTVAATTAAALGLTAVVIAVSGPPASALAVVVMAGAIIAGEALRADLPFRRGGAARFTLGDAALTAGFLVMSPQTVVIAAVVGMLIWQFAERLTPVKVAFNVAQYVAGVAAAGLAIEVLSPATRGLDPHTVVAVAAGISVFTLVNTTAVSGIIATTSGQRFLVTLHRMLANATLLAAGNACLGVLAVVLFSSHPWALPALAMPVLFLYTVSRQALRAQLERERSQALVEMEHRLSESSDREHVRQLLIEGANATLGCQAAIWRDGSWIGDLPDGSGPCPVDAALTVPLVARGPALGPAVAGPCMAIGLGDAVMVVWQGEMRLGSDSEQWLERLGTSGRVHSARSRAASDLRRQQATMRAVVHGTADGIFVMDRDGMVELCNPAMARLAQCAPADLVGRPADDVLGDGPWVTEGVHDVTRPGDRVWRLAVSPIHDGDRQLHVAVVHDVTSERRVARMKDDMLSIVSHELRTPLTPIKGSAQLLRRRWERMPVEQREEMLRHIEQRADHLTRLVEDLLLVGQLSASSRAHPRIVPVDTDLVDVIREGIEHLDRLHPEHHVTFTAPDELRLVADPLRVRQIVDNLVNNACKFSSAETTVDVELTTEGSWALLRVTDEGRGIPPEDVERIFERFERVEDPLHMTTSGAGLGLYIVKSLAQGMGGDVQLSSVLGTGTTVTIRLPLVAAGRGNGTTQDSRTAAVA